MERFSAREHLLAGHHSPRRSFGSSKLPATRNSSSDVDYNDVFGGPPRRSSLHEWRYSHGGGGGEDAGAAAGMESTSSSNNPWGFSDDKPVFGDENVNRRSNPSSEFFDDIFRGSESSVSTPTNKPSRDPFYSSPSSSTSRVLSPARPLPPQSEPFGAGSSLPLSLSLPTKLAKGVDQAFAGGSPLKGKGTGSSGLGFPSSPSSSRSSTLAVEGRNESRNDARPYFGKSATSRDLYYNRKDLSEVTKYDRKEIGDNGKTGLSSSDAINTSTIQFHFSIYRWVSKGAPLGMPLRRRNSTGSKGRETSGKIENEVPATSLEGVEQTAVRDNVVDGDSYIELEYENQDQSSGLDTRNTMFAASTCVQEAVSPKPQSGPISSSAAYVGKRSSEPVPLEESYKMELKADEELNKQGDDKMVKKAGSKGSAVGKIDPSVADVDGGKKVKKPSGKRSLFRLSRGNSNNSPGSATSAEDKPARSKDKGKVKDFVQIFNQEAPLTNVQKARVQDEDACKLDDRGSCILDTKKEREEKGTNVKNIGTFVDTSIMKEKDLEESHKPDIGLNQASWNTYDTSFEGAATSSSYPETTPDIFSSIGNMEESHFEDLQADCLVEELPPEQNSSSEASQASEEIQASDAKIRKWSNGKEGNIRSLLSTLQYVLWPESGWKPVPLVDIIEGTSVKKAYNKALLCLHPDKLQQKGAAPHQKYLAEKVFNILQEAWTHFNLVGGSF